MLPAPVHLLGGSNTGWVLGIALLPPKGQGHLRDGVAERLQRCLPLPALIEPLRQDGRVLVRLVDVGTPPELVPANGGRSRKSGTGGHASQARGV